MKLSVRGIPSERANALRAGEPDANAQSPLIRRAEGQGNPCRHCLGLIEEGDEKLVLAYRPFDSAQPYAEVGPIFLHRAECAHYNADRLPAWFDYLQPALVRGYGTDDWIRYETARVLPGTELTEACERILSDPEVAYVHIRSRYNCFQCRVERG